jgi:hypothetical protein
VPAIFATLAHPEVLEQLDIAGQRRLADMESRVMVLLQHHPAAFPRRKRRYRRARRHAAGHQGIALLRCFHEGALFRIEGAARRV